MNYTKIQKSIGFNVPKIYWNYTTKKVLTLDKVNGISIREHNKLKKSWSELAIISRKILYNIF